MGCFLQGSRVGYVHFRQELITVQGQPRVRYVCEDRMTLTRFQTATVVETWLECIETPGGEVQQFAGTVRMGPQPVAIQGVRRGDELHVETKAGGHTSASVIPFDASCGGFIADQQSLERQPMRPGERRQLTMLFPVVFQLAAVTLQAVGFEAVALPDGSRTLLRIDATTDVGGQRMRSVYWVDDGGQIVKTKELQLGMETVVSTKDAVMKPPEEGNFDLGIDTLVRLDRPLDRPHDTRRAVYRVSLDEGEIGSLFLDHASQRVRILDARTAEVTVLSVRPGQPPIVDPPRQPRTETSLSPSPLLQADDPRIVAMAEQAVPGEEDPWGVACALERLVKDKVTEKNYATAMATAAEVAASLEGDCTEHAMLLAALLRVRGIASRVAIGLVYFPAAQGFAYHMWTEAWIRDRWIPLDATLGQGGIGAAHLKLADSEMGDWLALVELQPVLRALGHLQVQLIDVEYADPP